MKSILISNDLSIDIQTVIQLYLILIHHYPLFIQLNILSYPC